jgi:HK97 family phage prohead protease
MSMKREVRFAGIELRASGDGKMVIQGRPAVYNSLSKDLGGFREVLVPGCFDESLDDPEIYCAWNHDNSQILGRVEAGTLQLNSDSIGLTMRCELPNSPLGQNVYQSVKRGDVSKMSFGMFVDQDAWDIATDERGQRYERRSVKQARIFECSPVTSPAYDASSVSARSLFPDGQPERIVTPPAVAEVSADVLRWMKAKLELAKRQ